MVKTNQVLLVLVLAIFISGGVGYVVGTSSNVTLPTQPAGKKGAVTSLKESVAAVGLENKVVNFISKSVSGTVKSVSNRTMVLEVAGDTLSFTVSDSARINRLTISSPKAPPSPEKVEGEPIIPGETPVAEELAEPKREEIILGQVKVGDSVDAILNSQPDGSFLAVDVTVMVETE